jgi:hypothetical protein
MKMCRETQADDSDAEGTPRFLVGLEKVIVTFWSKLSCTKHAHISLSGCFKVFPHIEVALPKSCSKRGSYHGLQSPACENRGRRKEWTTTRSSEPDVSHRQISTKACVDLIVSILRTSARRSTRTT